MRLIAAVSGSNGFIGKHLVKRLKELKIKVIPLDRKGNLPKQVDFIFDLAAYGNLSTQKDRKEIYRANVKRVVKLLDQVKTVIGIVLTSSSSVLLPVKTHYSISKEIVENLAEFYDDLPIVVARPSTVIGKGEPNIHLIPKLIDSCLNGTRMPFVESPTHDFISVRQYIEDIIDLALNAQRLKGKVVNVSSGKSLSNKKIKDTVELYCKFKANIEMVKSIHKYDTKDWKVKRSKYLGKVEHFVEDAIIEMI